LKAYSGSNDEALMKLVSVEVFELDPCNLTLDSHVVSRYQNGSQELHVTVHTTAPAKVPGKQNKKYHRRKKIKESIKMCT